MVAVQLPVQALDRLPGFIMGTVQVPDGLLGAGGGVDVETSVPVRVDGGRTPVAAAEIGGGPIASPVGITVNSFRESAHGDQENHKDNA